MNRKPLAFLAFAVALSAPASAQIRQPGIPATDWAPLSTEVPTSLFETPDIATLLEEDAIRGDFPLRYGDVMATDLSMESAGRWDIAPDGSQVWRLELHAPGAYSLGVVFSEFELPEGAQVFLYDERRAEIHGAYTSANHKPNGMLGIEPVAGDRITIEYVQPADSTGVARLTVGEVIYDYRDVLNLIGGGGPDGGSSCLIHINCPEGAPYQTIKRASLRTLAGGALCSASILNNTAQDGTPYMLTANHCGNMTNATFWFNYEKPGCGGGGATQDSLSGSTKLASTSAQDSQLYLLSTAIPSNYDPYYAGWDRTAQPTSGPAVTIGHGNGAPKQIAIDASGANTAGDFFNVFWTDGIAVGGNSGGPLFDGNQRVIGPACCVSNFNCGSQTTSFGRLNRFWNNNGLEQWLDPTGSGATQLDGLDPNSPTSAPVLTSVTPNPVASLGTGVIAINGSNMLGITSVQLGSQVLAPGEFTSVNSFLIELVDPLFANLGTVPVSVTNAIGTSNTVNMTVSDLDPPLMISPGLSIPGTEFKMSWGGQANDFHFVYWSFDLATVDLNGFDVLANSNLGLSGSLNAAGVDQFVIPSVGSLGFTTIHLQALTFDDVTTAFVGASNIASTLFL